MAETNPADRALGSMPVTPLTCAELETRHIEAHYLAGRLTPEETLSYEAHYFGCERCWALLRRATEARAAFATPGRVTARRFLPWGLALAAGITGVMLIKGPPGDRPAGTVAPPPAATPVPVVRGAADSLSLVSRETRDTIAAAWGRVAGAGTYQLRVFAPDGALVHERETADTSAALSLASLRLGRRVTPAFWQVQALDALRRPLARSAVVPIAPLPR